jgi:cytochrome c oxidase subunit 2
MLRQWSKNKGMKTAWRTYIERPTRASVVMLTALAWLLMTAPATLAEVPVDWQLGMQAAASPVREHIDALHDKLLVIISFIVLFVLALLLFVIRQFGKKVHPTPSQTANNRLIEMTWIMVPILILVYIAIPSFKLLYFMDRTQHAALTINATGNQWYWSYEYADNGGLTFDSTMLEDEDAAKYHEPRLLGVDKPLVVPVGANVRIIVGGTDVMHSWFVPAVGVQEYAIVGRKNESWMSIDRAGTYYGQCNQICGINHSFMPIEIKAVSQDDFNGWLKNPEQLWNVRPKKKTAESDAVIGDGDVRRLAAK